MPARDQNRDIADLPLRKIPLSSETLLAVQDERAPMYLQTGGVRPAESAVPLSMLRNWMAEELVSNLAGALDGNDILELLAPVDGAGSGLDADLLDGLDSTAFALAGAHTHVFADLTDQIADSQTPNTLLLDGTRTMTGDLTLDVPLLGFRTIKFVDGSSGAETEITHYTPTDAAWMRTDLDTLLFTSGVSPRVGIRIDSSLGEVSPTADATFDFGSPTLRWKDVYLTGNLIDGAGGGGLLIRADDQPNQNLTFETTSDAAKGNYVFAEMTTAGFLKNSVAGVVTGGNTAGFSDLTGTISDAQGPQFLLLDGSRDMAGDLLPDGVGRELGATALADRWERGWFSEYIEIANTTGGDLSLQNTSSGDYLWFAQTATDAEIYAKGNNLNIYTDQGGVSQILWKLDSAVPSFTADSAASLGTAGLPFSDLHLSGNILVGGTVDGRDVAADGTAQDSHIADTSNPHSVTAAQITGAAILAELLGVDGTGSLLDADLLDGNEASAFALASHAHAAADITSGVLSATRGGTGVADPTDHAVLVGSGAAAVTPIAVGTTDQYLQGVTGADPAFAELQIVHDPSPQLGADLDGQSLYDLNNIVDAEFEGAVGIGAAIPTADSLLVSRTSTVGTSENALRATITQDTTSGIGGLTAVNASVTRSGATLATTPIQALIFGTLNTANNVGNSYECFGSSGRAWNFLGHCAAVVGAGGVALHQSTVATMPLVLGLRGNALQASGTITELVGVRAQVGNAAGAAAKTATHAIAFDAYTADLATGSNQTITDASAFRHVGWDATPTYTNTAFGLDIGGASELNWIAGNLQVGSTKPSSIAEKLHVVGNISLTGTVDGHDIDAHIGSAGDAKHRIINDAGTSATELWSASKIDSEISAISGGGAVGKYAAGTSTSVASVTYVTLATTAALTSVGKTVLLVATVHIDNSSGGGRDYSVKLQRSSTDVKEWSDVGETLSNGDQAAYTVMAAVAGEDPAVTYRVQCKSSSATGTQTATATIFAMTFD